jgi:hypothetical protein
MKRVWTWLFWVILIVLPLIVAWVCFECLPSSPLRDNFLGDALATVIGAIIGIPIALWLGRRQQKEQEERELHAELKEFTERRAKILTLIKRELDYNQECIVQSKKNRGSETEKELPIRGFKDELCRAFSDGGELEWITNLDLLDSISQAYHYIRVASELESIYLQYHYYPGTYIQPRREEGIPVRLDQFKEMMLPSIGGALREINKTLAETDNPECQIV